ncbi:MAG: hypothetical protein NTZ38_01890, partial [Candidatus Taylorbacteria bacterium]|nr:hypothetical protein [Candidatus Taylorbacteria bacterium]
KSLNNLSNDVNSLSNNLDSISSTTNFSILTARANTMSLSELNDSVNSMDQSIQDNNKALIMLTDRINLMASTSLTMEDADIRYMQKPWLYADIGYMQNTTASSSADIGYMQTFIGKIAEAVKSLITSTGEWVVGKVTGTLAVFTRVETGTAVVQTLCVGNTCVTEDQLKALLQRGSIMPVPYTATTTPDGSLTSVQPNNGSTTLSDIATSTPAEVQSLQTPAVDITASSTIPSGGEASISGGNEANISTEVNLPQDEVTSPPAIEETATTPEGTTSPN